MIYDVFRINSWLISLVTPYVIGMIFLAFFQSCHPFSPQHTQLDVKQSKWTRNEWLYAQRLNNEWIHNEWKHQSSIRFIIDGSESEVLTGKYSKVSYELCCVILLFCFISPDFIYIFCFYLHHLNSSSFFYKNKTTHIQVFAGKKEEKWLNLSFCFFFFCEK